MRALYRNLIVTGDLDLINLELFDLKKTQKKGNTDLLFSTVETRNCQSLTNQCTGEFLETQNIKR